MQTILTVSIVLNVLLAGALIYLYRAEDKRRQKRESKAFVGAASVALLQASAREEEEYAQIVAIGRKAAELIPDALPVYVGRRFH